MTAYCLFDNLEVHDPAALGEYRERIAPILDRYGGEVAVVGGPWKLVEGAWQPTFPVLITFPDMAAADAWYHSDEYAPLKRLRLGAVSSNAVFFESATNAHDAGATAS